ncbi:MAG TPA: AAA family ATPase [Chthonomonas sp.]|uniref:AAA family ATPase n=1 Tax=Chthonomonas sp. TaxID=2282153 RepID=UPI002B4B616B|nr:AAA family ATPase [Chthonomonas sp.]HLI47627.1 AAA family ATPase [Chthonomonas sp.]
MRLLEKIVVQGYKSIRNQELSLEPVNVLIGANGSGKSNFIGLFRMLNRLVSGDFQIYVRQAGGPDRLLYYGRKTTNAISLGLWFRDTERQTRNGYMCELFPTEDQELVFAQEEILFAEYEKPMSSRYSSGVHEESRLPEWAKEDRVGEYIYKDLQSFRVYHFHDTSDSAKVKQFCDISDNRFLRPDASNLAAFLYRLKRQYNSHYQDIVRAIRSVAPFFGDFVLEPDIFATNQIRLEWHERGSDTLFDAHALSDGTLRFICFATLFLQPDALLPAIIILDEPELGLHPAAITVLAQLIHSASKRVQVLLATQSVTLVNQFTPEQIIVVERQEHRTGSLIPGQESVFHRISSEQLTQWLQEYELGTLWEKNLLGGRP